MRTARSHQSGQNPLKQNLRSMNLSEAMSQTGHTINEAFLLTETKQLPPSTRLPGTCLNLWSAL